MFGMFGCVAVCQGGHGELCHGKSGSGGRVRVGFGRVGSGAVCQGEAVEARYGETR